MNMGKARGEVRKFSRNYNTSPQSYQSARRTYELN